MKKNPTPSLAESMLTKSLRSHSLISALPSLVLALLLAGQSVRADDITWSGAFDTAWSEGGNWDGGNPPADSTITDIAVFGSSVAANQPNLTADTAINGLVFQSASGGWTIGGSSYSLSIGAGGIDDSANTGGVTTINANVSLAEYWQTWSVGAGGNLVVNGVTRLSGGNHVIEVTSGGTVTLSSIDSDSIYFGFSFVGGGTLAITGAAGSNLQSLFGLGSGTLIVGDKSAMGTGKLGFYGGSLQASVDLSGANAIANDWELGANTTFGGSNNITLAGTYFGSHNAILFTNDLAAGKMLELSGSIGLAASTGNVELYLMGTGDTTISGDIANNSSTGTSTASGLRIWNSGTTRLTGANTYTGATTVHAGTLLVDGTHDGGSANGYTVAAGATLGGTGEITTLNVTMAAGAKLTPGGTGIAEDLSFTLASGADVMDLSASSNGTGAYLFDLAAPSASDRIVLTLGTLDIGAMTNADFVFTELAGFGNGTYVLFDAGSEILGSVTSALNSISFSGGRTGTLSLDSINNQVLLTVVPEPSACALVACSLTSMVALRRRRRG